ncbi:MULTISPECIES: anti-repressor SinI family protein [Fictibacillus]|uniref:Sin domain-containing protein n=1 Tax=Fictibacillus enclensis TaxID=1017270 RepID=A0A0V8J2H6_9BACL|nr:MULTISPECIES: anti-repressor SinI family protein [Fictibacillus]KSU81097.1 hypothetical protein AS030_19330 [Fictibacillus enclensis]RXZ00623.1 DNA-binding anti-repressor SinI [Fictibacillus sp. S7]
MYKTFKILKVPHQEVNHVHSSAKDELTDPEWLKLVEEAMNSNITKEQFTQFLSEKKSQQ